MALAAMGLGAGVGMLTASPVVKLSWVPSVLGLLLVIFALASILPAPDDLLPAWRQSLPASVAQSTSWAAILPHLIFWWTVLVLTLLAGLFLLMSPMRPESLRYLIHVVAGLVFLYAVVSLIQHWTMWRFPFSGNAAFGLLPNRNHTAALLLFGSIVSLGLLVSEILRHHIFGALIAAVSFAVVLSSLLFLSISRAGVIFVVLGLLIWLLGVLTSGHGRKFILYITCFVGAFLTVLFTFASGGARERLFSLYRNLTVVPAGGIEVDFRLPIFRDTLAMIRDTPWTGQGLGHFEFVFPHYRVTALNAARIIHPESDWLMMVAEAGLPATVVLLLLVAWYFWTNWRVRDSPEGMLQWTMASSIGAVLLHGLIDVPWHRPALGGFFLVAALAAFPAGRKALNWPDAWRVLQLLCGLVLVVVCFYIAKVGVSSKQPLAHRWEWYSSELEQLLLSQDYERGELVSRQAIEDFPLTHHAYYWHGVFLKMFEGTDSEMVQAMRSGSSVEPILPWVKSEHAILWQGIDDKKEAWAWIESVQRADVIESAGLSPNLTLGAIEAALRNTSKNPLMQKLIGAHFSSRPILLGYWLSAASPDVADEYLSHMKETDLDVLWADLPEDMQIRLYQRWLSFPSAVMAATRLEDAKLYLKQPYLGMLARFYAGKGEKQRAVQLVLDGLPEVDQGGASSNAFAERIDELQKAGNDVAIRRLLKDVRDNPASSPNESTVALSWYISRGDWDSAWRIADRFVAWR